MKPRAIMLCVLMILAMAAVTAYYYPSLPEIIPVHWNAAGKVNGYGGRWQLWLAGPGTMTGMLLFAMAIPWLSPEKFEVKSFPETYSYIMAAVVALFGGIEIIMLCGALGVQLPTVRVLLALILLAQVFIGNSMGKVRRNFFIGIRTPWTLASEAVWYATHRLAARLMVASGLLGLLAVWLAAPYWVLLVLMSAWAPLAAAYSLLLYKRLPQ
jgi:uncharacterized membrane protein